nr:MULTISPECIES: sigma factor [Robinsoniella]
MLSLCHDKALAEEITQEAFFKAMQNIYRFEGEL